MADFRPAFPRPRPAGGAFPPRSNATPAAMVNRGLSPAAVSRNKDVKRWPNIGEIVVVRVEKILDYGVFCALLEYEGATGFVHISQVESSWIKNIRNYVKEGQMRAALVQKVDKEKLQIDLSLTKVSERTQRLRLEEFNQLNRNKKLIEVAAKTLGKTMDDGWASVAVPLIAEYGTLPQAFEAISLEGAPAAENILSKEWVAPVVDVVQKNIRTPQKEVKGTLSITCKAPDGIVRVKKALKDSLENISNATVQFSYLGAGKYLVKVVSFDYKLAERALSSVQERLDDELRSTSTIQFVRQEA